LRGVTDLQKIKENKEKEGKEERRKEKWEELSANP
jgi:hypothetical protein